MSKRKELAALRAQTEALTSQTTHMFNRNKEKLAICKDSLPREYDQRFLELKAAAENAANRDEALVEQFAETIRDFNLAARDFRDLIDDILGGSIQ